MRLLAHDNRSTRLGGPRFEKCFLLPFVGADTREQRSARYGRVHPRDDVSGGDDQEFHGNHFVLRRHGLWAADDYADFIFEAGPMAHPVDDFSCEIARGGTASSLVRRLILVDEVPTRLGT